MALLASRIFKQLEFMFLYRGGGGGELRVYTYIDFVRITNAKKHRKDLSLFAFKMIQLIFDNGVDCNEPGLKYIASLLFINLKCIE